MPDELDITDARDASRYEARFRGELAGWVDYRRAGPRLIAVHTEVRPEFEGRGFAKALIRRVLDDARAAGAKVSPICPMFRAHFEKHPEDADLLAERRGKAGR